MYSKGHENEEYNSSKRHWLISSYHNIKVGQSKVSSCKNRRQFIRQVCVQESSEFDARLPYNNFRLKSKFKLPSIVPVFESTALIYVPRYR